MKKICPFILLIWPYLFFPAAYLDSLTSEDGLTWLITYCVLTPVVYLANIICACRNKDVRSLTRWNMALKLLHIPSYLVVFIIGLASAVAMIKLPFAVILIPILVIIDCLLLATTSSYGICALLRAWKNDTVSTGFLVVNGILHFIFVLDVISSIVVFCKVRKKAPALQ